LFYTVLSNYADDNTKRRAMFCMERSGGIPCPS
jgi:hypothetical protein